MADTKLSALSETSVPALADAVYSIDVSDTTDGAGGSSRQLTLTRALGLLNNVCQGRLTLSTGNPVYDPLPATPSSTDTTAETTTFAVAHGWTTGTMATPSATGGGLTAGTTYYLNATSSTAVSYHTTLANAEAASSAVNLTASITAQIRPSGVQSTTIRFAPHNGNLISIYDGTRWRLYTFSELSLALGTLTSGLPYDAYVYDNSGTLTLELLAWTDGTTRATALVLQDGVYVKTGATTRRYLGTLYTISTTAAEDSVTKRLLWNLYNRAARPVSVFEANSTWTYTTAATFRQARASSANQIAVVAGLPIEAISLQVLGMASSTSDSAVSIGEDATTVQHTLATVNYRSDTNIDVMTASLNTVVPLGYHYYTWLEQMPSAGTATFYSLDSISSVVYRKAGLTGRWAS